MSTQFDLFLKDPVVKESMFNLLDRLMVYQNNLSTVKYPDKEKKVKYNDYLNSISVCRGQKLFYPYLSSGMGRGSMVELSDGSVKYDFISGIGVHWAHSDPDIIKASIIASLMDTVMQGNLQQHTGSVELYEMLTKLSGLDHAFLTSSGVMAWENAVKIAFHFKKTASRLLAFKSTFSGRTMTAAHVTDNPNYRKGLPETIPVDYIPFYDPFNAKESTELAVSKLNEYLYRYPDQHACMVFELIQGEGGFNVGSRSFFVALMSVLKKHNIAVYVDEIQTFGRTPDLFAFKMFKLEEYVDIVTIGKLSQVCATLFRSEMNPEKGLLSQTFTSSTTAIETSKIILKALSSKLYFGKKGKIARIHGYFARSLRQLFSQYTMDFKGPFGVGSMIAFEIFSGDSDKTLKFMNALFDNGVIAFIAGSKRKKYAFITNWRD